MHTKRFVSVVALLAAAALLTSCNSWPLGPYQEYTPQIAVEPNATSQPFVAATQPMPTTMGLETLEGEVMTLGVDQAVVMALANNTALAVDKYNPSIFRTVELSQMAVFDPVLTAGTSFDSKRIDDAVNTLNGVTNGLTNELNTFVGASAFLPTGTTVAASLSSDFTYAKRYSDQFANRAGLTVTQSLLRGAGLDVNLATLRQARLDTLASQYELRGFAESLVADVENVYWDYALAQKQITIFESSLQLAEDQLSQTKVRIEVGRLAKTELAASEAEVASRREDLIDARSNLDKVRLRFLRLLGAPGQDIWQRQLQVFIAPALPMVKLDSVEDHVKVALRMRPDLNQARLKVQRGDLEIVKTRNGLLPKLDLFVTLGKTGYAESFGHAAGNITDGSYDILAGAVFSYPPMNRDAIARNQAATLARAQSQEAVANFEQLVQQDVRSAYVETIRSGDQVGATAVTRQLQEEKVRAETERFKQGLSTSVLVAIVQRDLLASQIAEVQAKVAYIQALVNLHLLEGSLLDRWQIAAPGAQPVTGNEKYQVP